MSSYSSRKRVLERPRIYRGQEDAGPVVQWLNQNAGSDAARRVAKLIVDLTALCGSVRPLVLRFPPPEEMARFKRKHPGLYRSISLPEAVERGLISNPANWPVRDGFGERWDSEPERRAQAVLARYSFRPYIFDNNKEGGFQVEMLPSRLFTPRKIPGSWAIRITRPRRWITVADAEGKGREQESWTILRMIRLTRDGLIDRIRRCSCGKWFFAQHRQRRWCTTECRHREYKSTPEWKEKRNRYMRGYYRENYSQSANSTKEGSSQ